MTRQHFQKIDCPECGTVITAESAFGRWVRENPYLDSGKGYCVMDQDYWVHRYKFNNDRTRQLLMGVEIKTHGANLTAAQRDLLNTVGQTMRNRRSTPQKKTKYQAGYSDIQIKSAMFPKIKVLLRAYGMHVLRFGGAGPSTSDWIKWDGKDIDVDTLTRLLAFDLDPDTLQPIDLRLHHSQPELPLIDGVPLIGAHSS